MEPAGQREPVERPSRMSIRSLLPKSMAGIARGKTELQVEGYESTYSWALLTEYERRHPAKTG
jgi:hypothetical protein